MKVEQNGGRRMVLKEGREIRDGRSVSTSALVEGSPWDGRIEKSIGRVRYIHFRDGQGFLRKAPVENAQAIQGFYKGPRRIPG